MAKYHQVDTATKQAAFTLSGLLMTPASDLADYRDLRLGSHSTESLEKLQVLREVLLALAAQVDSEEESDWLQLQRIHGELCPRIAEAPPLQPVDEETEDAPIDSLHVEGVRRDEALYPAAAEVVEEPTFADDATEMSGLSDPLPLSPSTPADDEEEMDPAPDSSATRVHVLPGFSLAPALPFRTPEQAAPEQAELEQVELEQVKLEQVKLEQTAPAQQQPAAENSMLHFPLADYAALCARCSVFPDEIRETNRAFGIADFDARQTLDASWHDRFANDQELGELWQLLFTRFRGWLETHAP